MARNVINLPFRFFVWAGVAVVATYLLRPLISGIVGFIYFVNHISQPLAWIVGILLTLVAMGVGALFAALYLRAKVWRNNA